MSDTATRVARGAAWLDTKYPGWFQAIDLATLKISDCHMCVLGQVYTGAVSDAEKDQIVGQIVAGMSNTWAAQWNAMYKAKELGGYNVLCEFYDLDFTPQLGFAIDAQEYQSEDDDRVEYAALLDEWTRVIIERRLQAHPDLNDLTCSLAELRVPATVG